LRKFARKRYRNSRHQASAKAFNAYPLVNLEFHETSLPKHFSAFSRIFFAISAVKGFLQASKKKPSTAAFAEEPRKGRRENLYGFGAGLALPISRTTFQLPSACRFQMLVYLPQEHQRNLPPHTKESAVLRLVFRSTAWVKMIENSGESDRCLTIS